MHPSDHLKGLRRDSGGDPVDNVRGEGVEEALLAGGARTVPSERMQRRHGPTVGLQTGEDSRPPLDEPQLNRAGYRHVRGLTRAPAPLVRRYIPGINCTRGNDGPTVPDGQDGSADQPTH